MPVTAEQEQTIARAFIQTVHVGRAQTAKVDMNDLLAAAGDAYDWAEANQAGYNSALPVPFKTVAMVREKAELLEAALRELVKAS